MSREGGKGVSDLPQLGSRSWDWPSALMEEFSLFRLMVTGMRQSMRIREDACRGKNRKQSASLSTEFVALVWTRRIVHHSVQAKVFIQLGFRVPYFLLLWVHGLLLDPRMKPRVARQVFLLKVRAQQAARYFVEVS